MHVLSVDLGTSNTVAVLAAHGMPPRAVEVDGAATMPSAVFAAEDGTLVVGRDAQRRARLDPTRYEPNPKRRVDEQQLLLGDRVVEVVDALAAVLRRVTEEAVRQLGGQHPDQVRMTHPAQWGLTRCNVLRAAAAVAGLGPNPLLVPEPVAAAAHFASFPGKVLAPGQALAVYDLGAGTFDCAVVGATANGYAVLAEDGLADLGGLDVDQALALHLGERVSATDQDAWQRLLRPDSLADRRAQRALREDVTAAKETLSRHPQTEVPLPDPFSDVLVTRGELETLVRPNLLRSTELLAVVIARAGFTADRLAGIYLVGGSSRIPLVASLIGESLLVVPTSLDQPETAVAFGAHHVSGAGITGRTQDFGGPQQPPRQQSAPLPQNFPSRGFGQPYPAQPQFPVPAGQQGARSRRMPLLIGAAAVVVVLLVVGAIVLFTPGNDGTVSATACQNFNATKDTAGFTPCLRQLAGTVATRASCHAGDGNTQGDSGLPKLGGVSVTCTLPGNGQRQIAYDQSKAASTITGSVDAVVSDGGDKIEARWEGNGLSGRYVARTGARVGMLAFTVDDRPISGAVIETSVNGSPPDANQLADFFEQQVMPGTAS